MKRYRFEAEAGVEHDVESAFDWYESEEAGLGSEFLEQLRATYQRIIRIRSDISSSAPEFVAP